MPTPHRYSVADFRNFGQHYGIDYRFPMLGSRSQGPQERHAVVQGQVEELELRPGIRLTTSDLEILQHYESTSLLPSPLFIVVILQGKVRIRLGHQEVELTEGMATSTRFHDSLALNAYQVPGQRLRTLNLSLSPDALKEQAAHDTALTTLLDAPPALLHKWHLPGYLLPSLEDGLSNGWQGHRRQLLWEGLALQLLAHGAPGPMQQHSATEGILLPGERQRLEAVRHQLHDDPAKNHSLQSLAQLASMSSSSLRSKFRAAYGQSVFDYLRDRRLSLARELLLEGFSVQQAAHFCGYRHATNFATAFRRRFGIAPSDSRGQRADGFRIEPEI
ncbi:hypothetical protein L861_15925 [Litchfieldella anticariensis FP35 = DSM 16096]|uniref:HTH araC/xylS-type domain-containing protein n=1 Tax=Litchfieldella anticariensis (strain DSM 16096 / CECT 5854 / CIP 108499 / LMG 22089 / FP35) TaxID=1121939 RepID=S2LBS8_LITA3|nr:helix-turn-helix transcriptional regulator [Halomonas anticariensis]EPC02196.1 hypothetical protein L861_15925 [Halomonas anticariensis FP35 = DSM 16096]